MTARPPRRGKVTVAWSSGNGCPHPVGQTVWEIDRRSDGSYTGKNHGFASSGCADLLRDTTWEVSATELQACASGFPCGTYTRPAGPPPPAAPAAKPLSRLTVNEIVHPSVGAVYRPFTATVKNGAIITLCAHENFAAIPFSFSRYNAFNEKAAGSYENGVPKGARVLKHGTCMKVTARNPSKTPILFKIFDGIHSQARLVVNVMPSGQLERHGSDSERRRPRRSDPPGSRNARFGP